MTNTNVRASSGSERRFTAARFGRRALVVASVVASLALPSAVLASEPTAGYNQTPPAPSHPQPNHGVKPSITVKPTVTVVAPSPAPAPQALPFTGLDLRWVIGAGVLLLGMGLSIRLVQRRAHSR
jgi:hypothetical protein